MAHLDPHPQLAEQEHAAGLTSGAHLGYRARHRRLIERFSRAASARQHSQDREQDRVQRYQRERQTGFAVADPEDAKREAVAEAIATRAAGPHNGRQAVESIRYQRDALQRQLAPKRLQGWHAGFRDLLAGR